MINWNWVKLIWPVMLSIALISYGVAIFFGLIYCIDDIGQRHAMGGVTILLGWFFFGVMLMMYYYETT